MTTQGTSKLDRLAGEIADTLIYQECERGARSALAARLLRALGIKKRRRRPPRPNWTSRDRFLAPHDKRFAAVLKGVWNEEKRTILANMKRNPLPKGGPRGTRKKDNFFIDSWLYPQALFEKEIAAKGNKVLAALLGDSIPRTINLFDFASVSFDLVNKRALDWLRDYAPRLSANLEKVNYDTIRARLIEGVDAGEGMDKLRRRIEDQFSEWEKWRAERVSQSEVIRASNRGNIEVYKEAGFEKLIWFANPGACDLCQELDGKVVGVNETFFDDDYGDGQSLRHPACRCSVSCWDESWAD